MKYKIIFSSLIIITIGLFSTGFMQECDLIPKIPDANLEKAIKEQLGMEQTSVLTCVDLEILLKLEAPDYDIKILEGLQFAGNLEALYLSGNDIQDISVLRDLSKLRFIRLSLNEIVDVEPLANLNNIKTLGLNYNMIKDVSPLKPELLRNLESLTLTGNCIDLNNSQSITAISKLINSGVSVKYKIQKPKDECKK